jgi:ferredoxin
MDNNQRQAWLKDNSVSTTCPHCGATYDKFIVTRLPEDLQKLDKVNINGIEIDLQGDHCQSCGICQEIVPKKSMYHPLGDAPVCTGCYESLEDSDYTFAEDIGDGEEED